MAPTLITKAAESRKRKRDDGDDEESAKAGVKGSTAESQFKQKTLILSSRGVSYRQRHLMDDLTALLPHSKKDAKLDTKHQLWTVNELADLSSCNNAIFFEARRHQDLYLWLAKTPNGPSARFQLVNAHTMDELKLVGNCLKGSRPIVCFDEAFDRAPHWKVLKELLTHVFAVPKRARKAKPFVDHVANFSIADGKIWFRNYQIVDTPITEKKLTSTDAKFTLSEIGPRFVLTPIKIFEGSFGGATVFENKDYVPPSAIAASQRMGKAVKYKQRQMATSERHVRETNREANRTEDPLETGRLFA